MTTKTETILRDALAEVLEDAAIEQCDSCDGSGLRYQTEDACHRCGGCGEIVRYQIWPDHLRKARAALKQAEDISK